MRPSPTLWHFLRPHFGPVVLAPLAMALEVALDLLQPRFVQHLVDEGVARGNAHVVESTVGWMVATCLLAMLAGMACATCAVRAAYGLGSDLRRATFTQLQSLSFADLDAQESSALITRVASDVGQIQETVALLLRGMVRMPLLLVGSVVLAILIHPAFGWLFALGLPVLGFTLLVVTRQSFPLYRRVQDALERTNAVLQENLAGVRVVRSFARTEHELARFRARNDDLVSRTVLAAHASARSTPIVMLTLNLGIVGVLWWGGQDLWRGTVTLGAIVAVINYLNQALNALTLLANMLVQVSRARASAERVREFLELRPAFPAPLLPAAFEGRRARGAIEFEGVDFSYRPGTPVLRSVSLRIEAGQTVALVGATGAGKSTLLHLLARFYDVDAGRITIDGIDIREIAEAELRHCISFAFQESLLFNASVRDNVSLSVPDAPAMAVEQATRRAMAHDFVSARPAGYETIVGQRGTNLSGGQKQRLALSRALLPQAPILVLDDSTSAVDAATEARIFGSLRDPARPSTLIVVTQRVERTTFADRIVVLDGGAIAGIGTHAELLADSETYRRIVASQDHTRGPLHAAS